MTLLCGCCKKPLSLVEAEINDCLGEVFREVTNTWRCDNLSCRNTTPVIEKKEENKPKLFRWF